MIALDQPLRKALRRELGKAAVRTRDHNTAMVAGGSVTRVIPINRPTPVEIFRPRGRDTRPFARSSAGCPRCGIRGALGCRHQRPYDGGVR